MRILATLAGAAALLVTGGVSTAVAAPVADDTTARVSTLAAPPAGCNPTVTTSWGQTCFEYEGDDQWIRDLDPNGWQAVVHVQTNYGKNRYCGALPAADGWRECAYDHREASCVRFRMYEEKDGATRNLTGWTLWHRVSTGGFC